MSAVIEFFPVHRRSARRAAPAAAQPGAAPETLTGDQIEALVARGRRLQGEAVQAGFRALFRALAAQIARSPRLARAGLTDRRACC